jgi:hypothetical protein
MTKKVSSVKDWVRFASIVMAIALFLTTVFVEVYSQYGARPLRASSQREDIWPTTHLSTAKTVGQTRERILKKGTFRNEPMRVIGIKAKGKTIESDKKFVEEDDWLDSLTIKLKNVSDKPIIFIEVSLTFPAVEGNPDGPEPGYVRDIKYGLEPIPGAPALPDAPKAVMPKENVDIVLTDEDREAIQGALIKLNFPRSTHIKMLLRTVIFDDDTMWRAGEILRRDSNEPGTWKAVPRVQGRVWSQEFRREFSSLYNLNPALVPRYLNNAVGTQRMAHVRSPPVQQIPCISARFDRTTNLACSSASGCTVKKDHVVSDLSGGIVVVSTFEDCRNSSGNLCKDGFFPIRQLTQRTEACLLIAGTCNGPADYTSYPSTGCIIGLIFGGPCTRSNAFISRCADPSGYDQESCSCPDGQSNTPIVIDVDHNGFSMTDAPGGVVFDFLNDGVPLQISWTAAGSTNAFLVLDRNSNGTIDNGTEMFGDLTPQPVSSEANGFLALAQYDTAGNGGNGNGRTDAQDATFSNLRLWQDVNHNGFSEASELHTLGALGITGIDLKYKESKKTDAFGNKFRYRAKVYDANGAHSGRWAWDVFLTVQ